MGGKDEAKRMAQAAGVPVLPGYAGEDQTDDALERAAKEVGYPVMVKPAAGGGGKGMAVVRAPEELAPALASARRVAAGAFGDDRLLLERYLAAPRHVEVQVVADTHGNVLHLGERDCSLQRRHQKILEETPSPAVDAVLREQLCSSAVALARHVGYRSAGTCEFLVDDDKGFGFIEMNARLQVEHPVTEMVTGLDLVELQLRVAMGEPLPLRQEDVRPSGHAIEVRLYAEDPDEGFLPQSGRILHLRWPQAARVDSGVEEGSAVTSFYDPMLAKVIVHGADRRSALGQLDEALGQVELLGVRTNLPFLRAVTSDPVVTEGRITTNWLEGAYDGWRSGAEAGLEEAMAVAAAAEADIILAGRTGPDPWSVAGPFRLGGRRAPVGVVLCSGGDEHYLAVEDGDPYRVGDHAVAPGPDRIWILDGRPATAVRHDDTWLVWWDGAPHEMTVGPRVREVDAEAGPAHLGAPMPGTVIAVRVSGGERVSRGQELVIVEAMKMELAVKASADGVVKAVLCAPGDQVDRGQTLVDLEPDSA
jgi:3-methylcrotonyl-CoA carboxylase alpha subunit